MSSLEVSELEKRLKTALGEQLFALIVQQMQMESLQQKVASLEKEGQTNRPPSDGNG